MDRPLLFLCVSVCVQLIAAFGTFPARIPNVGTNSKVPAPTTLVNGATGQTCRSIGHASQCEGPPSGGGNLFGKTFFNEGQEWNEAVCRADSDKDGYTNGEELGDPHCRWTKANPTALFTTNLSHPGFSCSTPQNPSCLGSAPAAPSGQSDTVDDKPSWKVAMALSLLIGALKLALTFANDRRTAKTAALLDSELTNGVSMTNPAGIGGNVSYVNAGFDKDNGAVE